MVEDNIRMPYFQHPETGKVLSPITDTWVTVDYAKKHSILRQARLYTRNYFDNLLEANNVVVDKILELENDLKEDTKDAEQQIVDDTNDTFALKDNEFDNIFDLEYVTKKTDANVDGAHQVDSSETRYLSIDEELNDLFDFDDVNSLQLPNEQYAPKHKGIYSHKPTLNSYYDRKISELKSNEAPKQKYKYENTTKKFDKNANNKKYITTKSGGVRIVKENE